MAFISRAGYTDPAQIHIGFTIMSSIMGILITWIYYAAFESSRHQATLGKMALGLRVTDCYGRPISYGRASARYFGKLLSSLILGLGYLMAAFTERKQALHDIMAGCLVIKKDADSSSLPVTMKNQAPNDDEPLYCTAQNEIESNTMRDGLWAKAFEKYPSDNNQQRAEYLRLRVAQLRAEENSILPPSISHFQNFRSTALAKLFRRTDIRIILIIALFAGVGTLLDNHERISGWFSSIGMTTVEKSYDGCVHVSYYINGKQFHSYNNGRVSYRGDTIYIYSLGNRRQPDSIIRGAREIQIWTSPFIM